METQTVEYKQTWRDDFLKEICAFANSQGGTLYVGIADNGEVVGVENPHKLQEDIPNKIVQKTGNGIRLVIIDGLGGTELIPISHWFKSICHQKTVRHWAKLCRKITRRNPKVTF